MYVLDTNTLIYFFKGMGNVAQRLLAVSPQSIGIPSVVLYELEVGIAKSSAPQKRQQQLDELCSLVNLLEFGRPQARIAAGIRATLEQKGTPIGPMDLLIAATALSHRGVLVTRNIQEFSRIPALSLENWYQ